MPATGPTASAEPQRWSVPWHAEVQEQITARREPTPPSWQPIAMVHLNRNSSLHSLFWINALHKKSQSHFSHECRNTNVGFSDQLHLQHDPLAAASLAYETVRCIWGISAQLATLTSQPWVVLRDYWQPGKTKLPCFLGSTLLPKDQLITDKERSN